MAIRRSKKCVSSLTLRNALPTRRRGGAKAPPTPSREIRWKGVALDAPPCARHGLRPTRNSMNQPQRLVARAAAHAASLAGKLPAAAAAAAPPPPQRRAGRPGRGTRRGAPSADERRQFMSGAACACTRPRARAPALEPPARRRRQRREGVCAARALGGAAGERAEGSPGRTGARGSAARTPSSPTSGAMPFFAWRGAKERAGRRRRRARAAGGDGAAARPARAAAAAAAAARGGGGAGGGWPAAEKTLSLGGAPRGGVLAWRAARSSR